MLKKFFCDRRNSKQHWSLILTALFFIGWTAATVYAQQKSSSIIHESTISESTMSWQIYIIIGLFGALTSLITYVFLSNVRDIKMSIRENHRELKGELEEQKKEINRRVRIQVHNAICEHKISEE